jgi:hypothetical protein
MTKNLKHGKLEKNHKKFLYFVVIYLIMTLGLFFRSIFPSKPTMKRAIDTTVPTRDPTSLVKKRKFTFANEEECTPDVFAYEAGYFMVKLPGPTWSWKLANLHRWGPVPGAPHKQLCTLVVPHAGISPETLLHCRYERAQSCLIMEYSQGGRLPFVLPVPKAANERHFFMAREHADYQRVMGAAIPAHIPPPLQDLIQQYMQHPLILRT